MTGLVERLSHDELKECVAIIGWVFPAVTDDKLRLERLWKYASQAAARIEALEAGLRAILEANDAAVTAMLECTDDDEAMRLASIRGVTFGAVIEDARALLASLLLSSGGGGSARVSLTAAGSDLATPGKDGVSR